MTNLQYLAALKRLGLTPASKRTAAVLGISLRTSQYYATDKPIPEPIAKLLRCYLTHGLPAS